MNHYCVVHTRLCFSLPEGKKVTFVKSAAMASFTYPGSLGFCQEVPLEDLGVGGGVGEESGDGAWLECK